MISQDFEIFFGDQDSNLEVLEDQFPQYRFRRIKQVHGDQLVQSTLLDISSPQEADAHWTQDSDLALLIATADCIPVLIFCSQIHKIMAIHAGWRGVENQIVTKSIGNFLKSGSISENLQIFIGPHIQAQSFEIENNLRDQILSTVPKSNVDFFTDLQNGKSLVNLQEVVVAQLAHLGVSRIQIQTSAIDTVTNKKYHSYRRDKEKSGRQLSFIALKSSR